MKTIKIVFVTIFTFFIIWIGASWVDIAFDNNMPNPQHAKWNYFVLFTPMGNQEETEQMFDTSALENWCGRPSGQLHMVGGYALSANQIMDDNGTIWGWDSPIDEQALLLLWVDDSGLIKVWQESY